MMEFLAFIVLLGLAIAVISYILTAFVIMGAGLVAFLAWVFSGFKT